MISFLRREFFVSIASLAAGLLLPGSRVPKLPRFKYGDRVKIKGSEVYRHTKDGISTVHYRDPCVYYFDCYGTHKFKPTGATEYSDHPCCYLKSDPLSDWRFGWAEDALELVSENSPNHF